MLIVYACILAFLTSQVVNIYACLIQARIGPQALDDQSPKAFTRNCRTAIWKMPEHTFGGFIT